MKIEDFTKEELVEFGTFVKNQFIFSIDNDKPRYVGMLGDIKHSVSIEMCDDIFSTNFITYLFTKSVDNPLDERQALFELIYEDMCQLKFFELRSSQHEYPECGSYSSSELIPKLCKLKYVTFADKFVDNIVEFVKSKGKLK